MLTAWAVARWKGRNAPATLDTAPGKLNDAILALLGLLLAFTFSMSLVKHEQRRQMAVTDSNAIGDFYTCVSFLKEPARGGLQSVVREYVEHRLSIARTSPGESDLQRELETAADLHRQMQALVGQAIDDGTTVVVPLVNTLNAVTSSHAARLAAIRDRLPPSIVLLLALAAVLSMALTGRQQGASNEWRPGSTIVFVALVCMVLWVTLDLNQPQGGSITVSQEPLERLLATMPE
jgi:hypothetical protein